MSMSGSNNSEVIEPIPGSIVSSGFFWIQNQIFWILNFFLFYQKEQPKWITRVVKSDKKILLVRELSKFWFLKLWIFCPILPLLLIILAFLSDKIKKIQNSKNYILYHRNSEKTKMLPENETKILHPPIEKIIQSSV